MKDRFKNACAGLLFSVFVFSSHSQAALVDHGDYFSDTETHIDWLDLTATAGQSTADISSRFSGDLSGWQFATQHEYELLTMGKDYLDMFPNSHWMPYVSTSLTATLSSYLLNAPVPDDLTNSLYSPTVIYGFIGRLVGDTGREYNGSIYKWDYDLFSDSRLLPNAPHVDGTFVIRRSVPESSTLMLFVIGVAGLFLRRKLMQ